MSSKPEPTKSLSERWNSYWTPTGERNLGIALFAIGFLAMIGGMIGGSHYSDFKDLALGIIIGGFVTACIAVFLITRALDRLHEEKQKKEQAERTAATSQAKRKSESEEPTSPAAAKAAPLPHQSKSPVDSSVVAV